MHLWQTITHLGASGLLLPIIALLAVALWQTGQQASLRFWLAGIAIAVFLTLASKIAFMGWGIGLRALDFTGISGHTVLATAVLPMLFAVAARNVRLGLAMGGLGAVLVGISRLVLNMHSLSEVLAGWALGALVVWIATRAWRADAPTPRIARAAPLLLLLAIDTSAATYLPSHEIEIRIALALSGRSAPFTRHMAH